MGEEAIDVDRECKPNQTNNLLSVKQVYLVSNIRNMFAGSIDTCVVNMGLVSDREAVRSSQELENLERYCCICFYNLL